jgi:hypothetical protein
MPRWLKRLLLFLPPLLVGALNIAHPIAHTPIYEGILHHVEWWISLHLLNLVGFPLVGLAGFFLTETVHTSAAIVSRVALAVFIPLYAGFDALAGIGTGILVQLISHQSPAESVAFEPIVTSYWNSGIIVALGVIGSIAWTIAMLSAGIALTVRDRRSLVAVCSILVFCVIGWARTNLMSPDGATISLAWWLVTVAVGLVMFIVGKPRLPAALLTLSATLFGAAHPWPTGPLGLACFLGAAIYTEFWQNRYALEQS